MKTGAILSDGPRFEESVVPYFLVAEVISTWPV